MKKLFLLTTMLFALFLFADAQTNNPKAVADLLNRIGGDGASDRFVTVLDENLHSADGDEVFVITAHGGKPCIKGSTLSALTTGVNWYLNHHAHINLAWNNPKADLVSADLPVPSGEEVHETTADYRYYLNYCTFSYSMAFWTWERWQQEVDWMALHGINMPLQMVGLDVVWKGVLEELGFSADDIDAFIAGPGFQAWWAMNNLEGWGATINAEGLSMNGNPDWWYKRQEELCGNILARMRELGMSPVLPGYCGMVPNSIGKYREDWVTINGGNWAGGFDRPDILDPRDTDNFNEMCEIYYRHLKRIMGTSEFYSMDPFHEASVPAGYEGDIYNGVMAAMDDYAMTAEEKEVLGIDNPKWIVQYWQGLPNTTGFASVPVENPDRFIALDLFSDGNPNWSGSHYNGHDFIFCQLSNFGGRTGLHGRIKKTMEGYFDAIAKSNMKGVGATPEGIENNPVIYDMIFELPWISEEPTPEAWLAEYAYSRYGVKSAVAEEAWRLLMNSVYNCTVAGQQGTSEAVILARPALTVNSVSSWSKSAIYWDVQDVLKAADLLLSLTGVPEKSKPNYDYDVVDVVRQSIVDFAYYLLADIRMAKESGDVDGYERLYKIYLQLMLDVDAMLANDYNFTLERWTEMARDVTDEAEGTSLNDKNWMEWNARTQITVWAKSDGNLHDYSNRCWSGLIKDFHYERWKYFFENGCSAPAGGWYDAMERPWTLNFDKSYKGTTTNDDAVEVARATFAKYFGIYKVGDGAKIFFPMGVMRDLTKEKDYSVCEIYRGKENTLPLTIGDNVTVTEIWIDLNADLARTDDEVLACNGLTVLIPATAKIGVTNAELTLSNGTEIKFNVAIREDIIEARTVSVTTKGNGTVSIDGADGASVTNTEAVTIVATPANGYNFYRWLDGDGNVVSTDNPFIYYAKEAAVFEAEFVEDKWGVIGGQTSSYPDIATYSQYVDKITFARYNREVETVYEASSVPGNIHTTVSKILNVARGSSFDITWSDPTDGLKYTYLRVYIDLNADGDFDDEGELLKTVGTVGGANNAVCAGTINVLLPYDMPLGLTHMRMRFDGAWDSPESKGAKSNCIRPVYEVILNVTDFPETSSLVDIHSNNNEWGTAAMFLEGQLTTEGNTGDDIPVASGLLMTLKATLSEGAEFEGWFDRYGRVVSTELEHKMYAPEDTELTAVFLKTLTLGDWEFEFRADGTEIILTKVVASAEGDIEIPETVRIDQTEYSVVGFENGLFNNNKNITAISLPKSIKFLSSNTVFETSVYGNATEQIVNLNRTVASSEKWNISLTVEDGGGNYNQWGSCLLATGTAPFSGTYPKGFQFYLQAGGNLVFKTDVDSDAAKFTHLGGCSTFTLDIEYDGATIVAICTNAAGEAATLSVSQDMGDFSQLVCALPNGVNITKLELGVGERPCAFSGCSNLDAINVEVGNKYYSSKDGSLYNADGSVLLCTPEGKEKGADRRKLGALIEQVATQINKLAVVTPNAVKTELRLQTTEPEAAGYLWTNAQEVKEGDISNLIDNDGGTFFHTNWSSTTAPTDGNDHHITVNLNESAVRVFGFDYQARSGGGLGDYPKKIVVQGSTDGIVYETIATIEHTGTVPQNGAKYSSEILNCGKACKYLRFVVTETTSNRNKDGHIYWHMAEFDLFKFSAKAEIKTAYKSSITSEKVVDAYECNVIAKGVYDNGTTAAEMQAACNELMLHYNNLLAGNYPFEFTTEEGSPVLYNIVINRPQINNADAVLQYWGTDNNPQWHDYKFKPEGFVLGNDKQLWYFTRAEEGKVYIHPYAAGDGWAVGTNEWQEGAGKVAARPMDTEGFYFAWNVAPVSETSEWSNITIENNGTAYYLSNHGGVSNDMGFYNDASDGGSQFKFVKVGRHVAVVSGAKYSTLMLGYDAAIPEGVTANIVSSVDGETGVITLAEVGSLLPANTPVILYSETAKEYLFYSADASSVTVGENLLCGTLVDTAVKCEDGYNYYMLMNGNSGVKMYWAYEEYNAAGELSNPGTDDGGYILCKANRAYLPIKSDVANSVSAFFFRHGNGTTAVEPVEKTLNDGNLKDVVYDLKGYRVTNPEKGIYIVNGKKHLVK